MTDIANFYPHAYLLNGAYSAFKTSEESPAGSNYSRIAAAVFAAFSFEAFMNFAGQSIWPFWSDVEQKLSWKTKLKIIMENLELALDWGQQPFQDVAKLFKLRDRLAHGKQESFETTYAKDFASEPRNNMFPSWLSEYLLSDQVAESDDLLKCTLKSTQQLIEIISGKLNLNPLAIHMIADGESSPGNEYCDLSAEELAANEEAIDHVHRLSQGKQT